MSLEQLQTEGLRSALDPEMLALALAQQAADYAQRAIDYEREAAGGSAVDCYQTAAVLLERAAQGSIHAGHFASKANEYSARAALLEGGGDGDKAAALFGMLDADGDGKLDRAEFRAGVETLQAQLLAPGAGAVPADGAEAITGWSAVEVARWAREDAGLPEGVAAALRDNQVTGKLLVVLRLDDLRELGIQRGVDRKRLMVARARATGQAYRPFVSGVGQEPGPELADALVEQAAASGQRAAAAEVVYQRETAEADQAAADARLEEAEAVAAEVEAEREEREAQDAEARLDKEVREARAARAGFEREAQEARRAAVRLAKEQADVKQAAAKVKEAEDGLEAALVTGDEAAVDAAAEAVWQAEEHLKAESVEAEQARAVLKRKAANADTAAAVARREQEEAEAAAATALRERQEADAARADAARERGEAHVAWRVADKEEAEAVAAGRVADRADAVAEADLKVMEDSLEGGLSLDFAALVGAGSYGFQAPGGFAAPESRSYLDASHGKAGPTSPLPLGSWGGVAGAEGREWGVPRVRSMAAHDDAVDTADRVGQTIGRVGQAFSDAARRGAPDRRRQFLAGTAGLEGVRGGSVLLSPQPINRDPGFTPRPKGLGRSSELAARRQRSISFRR
jgi:hypothetical protein